MFLHLVYASSATDGFSSVALRDLVDRSKSKNEQIGITAMLLHQRGAFLHGIEGEEAKVRALFSIVCADPRHRNTEVLVEMQVSERLFANQPMGFHDADLKELEAAKIDSERFGPSTSYQGFSWRGCIAVQLLAPFRS